MTYLETARLRLRRFTAGDADALLALDADPEVRRYVHLREPPTRETVVEHTLPRLLAAYERSADHGTFAAETRDTGAFLGWFHLRPFADDPTELEIGYRLRRAAWGHGYATEGSRALVRKAFEELGARRVVAVALAANVASIRVMAKAGLRFDAAFEVAGETAVRYALERAAHHDPSP
jgi:RimJ/RimL family protein N-acetyltransferase